MKTLARYALSIGAAAALLAGCGGSQPLGLPGATRDDSDSPTHRHTFKYTGATQSFIVPAGVTRITVVARGARVRALTPALIVPPTPIALAVEGASMRRSR